jgi:hypothetical protein
MCSDPNRLVTLTPTPAMPTVAVHGWRRRRLMRHDHRLPDADEDVVLDDHPVLRLDGHRHCGHYGD